MLLLYTMENINNVDEYISSFPQNVALVLAKIRKIIKESSSNLEEGIFYGMPGYKLNKKPLVYFGAYPKHIGFYATPSGHRQFSKELSGYKQGKGSVQFPLSEPIPFDLIKRMVEFRVKENL